MMPRVGNQISALGRGGPPAMRDDPATPAAIAALRAQPQFADAMRRSAAGLIDLYQGSHLLNWLIDDRGRMLFGYIALYLHLAYDPADPSSGLFPTRMRMLAADLGICSPGRAHAMLSLMRFGGYLTPAVAVVDRRQRRLLATEKLFALLEQRWRLHFAAIAPLFPDGEVMVRALDNPAFKRALMIAMGERFIAGFRFATHAPQLGLFGERNAGLLICCSLMVAGDAGDTVPPTRPVPISIAALARRFAVSRPHVLKLMRDAEAAGLIARNADRIVIKRALADGVQTFFASMYLFIAACAREAMATTTTRAAS
jgi:hypothetical protein